MSFKIDFNPDLLIDDTKRSSCKRRLLKDCQETDDCTWIKGKGCIDDSDLPQFTEYGSDSSDDDTDPLENPQGAVNNFWADKAAYLMHQAEKKIHDDFKNAKKAPRRTASGKKIPKGRARAAARKKAGLDGGKGKKKKKKATTKKKNKKATTKKKKKKTIAQWNSECRAKNQVYDRELGKCRPPKPRGGNMKKKKKN